MFQPSGLPFLNRDIGEHAITSISVVLLSCASFNPKVRITVTRDKEQLTDAPDGPGSPTSPGRPGIPLKEEDKLQFQLPLRPRALTRIPLD